MILTVNRFSKMTRYSQEQFITKSKRNVPAIHTAVHMYVFPNVTFSSHSWYARSDKLTFPYTKITQSKLMDCYVQNQNP